jgi:hypothetical protein
LKQFIQKQKQSPLGGASFAILFIACGGIIDVSLGITPTGDVNGTVFSAKDFEQWGRETLETIERDHRDKSQLGYYENQDRKDIAFTWSNSILLLAYAKAAQIDKSCEKPLDLLVQHMDRYWIVYKGIGGYDHLPHPKSVVERYYDDNAWIAMGQIDAYHATGKNDYLQAAAKAYWVLARPGKPV